MATTTNQPGPAPEHGREPSRQTRTVQDSGPTPHGRDGDPAPQERSGTRLPHEHDESTDSQNDHDREPPAVGEQAYEDLRQGRQDTDKGPVYDKLRKQSSS